MIAAAEKNLPIVVGGWEDSTMGNIFASYVYKGEIKASTMKSGIEYMVWLANYYKNNSSGKGIGFFQIGGGIAGDFPICVVPMMYQDLEMHEVPFWSYFCQISVIQLHLMVPIQEPCQMKKLRGVNWIFILQNILLKVMLPL